MKRTFATLMLGLMSLSCMAYSVKHEGNMMIVEMDTKCESLEKHLNNIMKEMDNNTSKVIIKYDGKWKYVIPNTESIIMIEILIDKGLSNDKVVKALKENKGIVTIR